MKNLWVLLLISFLYPALILAIDRVEINSASLEQLDKLTGIGPALGQRIIDARPFSSIDDLTRVKGVGGKTLQDIKDQGLAYVGNLGLAIVDTIPSPPPEQKIVYPSGVFINEILPNPKGADETDEWIELFNTNNFDIDLSGWQIKDSAGTITSFKIPPSTTILAGGYLVFKRPDTKIMLNNSGDGLILFAPDNKIIDSVNYTTAPLAQSYNKSSTKWAWSIAPTPGTKNIITTTQNIKPLPSVKNSVKKDNTVIGLADLSQSVDLNQKNSGSANPWFLFFTVLATTIILASAVLFIKLRVYRNKRETQH